MNLVTAIGALNELVGLILSLASHAQHVSDLIKKAHDEGRDLTPEEHQSIIDLREAARQRALEAVQ